MQRSMVDTLPTDRRAGAGARRGHGAFLHVARCRGGSSSSGSGPLIVLAYSTRGEVRVGPYQWVTLSWLDAFKAAAAQWYAWGLLSVAIYWVNRKLPVASDALLKRMLIHVPLSIVFTVAYTYLNSAGDDAGGRAGSAALARRHAPRDRREGHLPSGHVRLLGDCDDLRRARLSEQPEGSRDPHRRTRAAVVRSTADDAPLAARPAFPVQHAEFDLGLRGKRARPGAIDARAARRSAAAVARARRPAGDPARTRAHLRRSLHPAAARTLRRPAPGEGQGGPRSADRGRPHVPAAAAPRERDPPRHVEAQRRRDSSSCRHGAAAIACMSGCATTVPDCRAAGPSIGTSASDSATPALVSNSCTARANIPSTWHRTTHGAPASTSRFRFAWPERQGADDEHQKRWSSTTRSRHASACSSCLQRQPDVDVVGTASRRPRSARRDSSRLASPPVPRCADAAARWLRRPAAARRRTNCRSRSW